MAIFSHFWSLPLWQAIPVFLLGVGLALLGYVILGGILYSIFDPDARLPKILFYAYKVPIKAGLVVMLLQLCFRIIGSFANVAAGNDLVILFWLLMFGLLVTSLHISIGIIYFIFRL